MNKQINAVFSHIGDYRIGNTQVEGATVVIDDVDAVRARRGNGRIRNDTDPGGIDQIDTVVAAADGLSGLGSVFGDADDDFGGRLLFLLLDDDVC